MEPWRVDKRRMGTEADAAAVDLLRSQIPFQIDGEFVLPPRDVGVVLVDLCNGFCTVGAGNLVSLLLLFTHHHF
jgi:hypothetical protein